MNTAADTALLDQVHAAQAEADRLMTTVAEELNLTGTWAQPGPWLVELVHSTVGTGPATTRACPHVLARLGPDLTFLLAHRRRLSCARCTARWSLAARGTTEDRTCDVCRTVLGPGQVYAVQVRVGAVLWLADLEAAGQDAGVWRPADYLVGRVAAALHPRGQHVSGATP